jgi:quinol monooxygenase YgiN
MIQAYLRLVAPEDKRKEFLDVLLSLKGPTEASMQCRECWVCQDVKSDHTLTYLVQWDTMDDLESHLRSERFRRLLPYIEMSAEPPVFSVGTISDVRGAEFLADVLNPKTQQIGG